MKQNIYDNESFFRGYKELRDNDTGLNGVLEEPAFRSMLPDLRGKAILDLGCGMGNFAVYAMEHGAASYLGVDISRNMIDVARQRVVHPSIMFVNEPVEDYAIESSKYDLIVSSLCLHYIENYDNIVAKVAKGLKPGGLFAFSVEHPVCTASIKDQLWCEAADGTKRHWILDDYRSEGLRQTHWFVGGVTKYHRTTETYVNCLISQGLAIARLLEPAAIPEAIEKRPDLVDQSRRPPFLLLAAVKNEQCSLALSPKQLLSRWVELFNKADADALAELYHDDAINHQVANEPIEGKENIRNMFEREFAAAEMVCIVENLFEDGEWAILEWKDPLGLRGCGFFHVVDGKIKFQRGYWDKLSFLRQHSLPIPTE